MENLTADLCASREFFFAVFADSGGKALLEVYAWVPLAGAIVTVLLAACHAAADRFSAAYRRLDVAQRLVTSFHLAYTLAYGIAVVPFTYYLCRLLFSDLQDAASTYLPVLICFNLNLSLYLAEAAARAVVKRSWLLLFHHTIFQATTVVGFYQFTLFGLKFGGIFTLFAMFEVLLFATLAARKLEAPTRAVVALWWASMALYTATRVLQLVVFIPLFVSGYGQLRDCGQLGVYFFYLVVLIAVVFVQLLTYPIYWGVLRRTLRGSSSRIALANPTLATTAPLGTSPTAADPSPSLHGSASCSTGFKDSASGSDSAV